MHVAGVIHSFGENNTNGRCETLIVLAWVRVKLVFLVSRAQGEVVRKRVNSCRLKWRLISFRTA